MLQATRAWLENPLNRWIAKCELINPLINLSSAFPLPNHLSLQRSKGCSKIRKIKQRQEATPETPLYCYFNTQGEGYGTSIQVCAME